MSDHKHILALDLLRGYLLFVIFIDHFYRFPSLFVLFTASGKLWVSAAEGFFIISGLLVGCIYGPKITTNIKKVWLKIWHRAAMLYLCSIALTLLFTLWGQFLPLSKIKSGIYLGTGIFDLFYKTITLKYIYGWADYLAYYAVFMLFAPLALLVSKKIHGGVTIAASFLIWLFFRQLNGFFAWQFLFMTGLVIGENLPIIELKIRKLVPYFNLITVITLLVSIYFVIIGQQDAGIAFWFDKNTVGFGRYLLAWIWFGTLYMFLRSHEKKVDWITRGVLRNIGQNSLFVYSLQAIILFPINYLVQAQFGFIGNTLLTFIGGLLIYLVNLIQRSKSQKPEII